MKQNNRTPERLQEGIHFYIEDGKYVFTQDYLAARGACCGSACRHCPYGHANVPKSVTKKQN